MLGQKRPRIWTFQSVPKHDPKLRYKKLSRNMFFVHLKFHDVGNGEGQWFSYFVCSLIVFSDYVLVYVLLWFALVCFGSLCFVLLCFALL